MISIFTDLPTINPFFVLLLNLHPTDGSWPPDGAHQARSRAGQGLHGIAKKRKPRLAASIVEDLDAQPDHRLFCWRSVCVCLAQQLALRVYNMNDIYIYTYTYTCITCA